MERWLIFVAAADREAANSALGRAGLGSLTFNAGLLSDPRLTEPDHFWCCTVFGSETKRVLDLAGIGYRSVKDSRGVRLSLDLEDGKSPEVALVDEGLTRESRSEA